MEFFVGTSGYSYPAWKGNFYPAKMPARQMLGFYAARFRTVEINNTFYRCPRRRSSKRGRRRCRPSSASYSRHRSRSRTCAAQGRGDLVTHLLEAAGALKERLGPLLFQLPPNFKKDVPRLCEFLALLPWRVPGGGGVPPCVVVRRRGLRSAP